MSAIRIENRRTFSKDCHLYLTKRLNNSTQIRDNELTNDLPTANIELAASASPTGAAGDTISVISAIGIGIHAMT